MPLNYVTISDPLFNTMLCMSVVGVKYRYASVIAANVWTRILLIN